MQVANIVLLDGTKITIEGKPQEVAAIIKEISQPTTVNTAMAAARPKELLSKHPRKTRRRHGDTMRFRPRWDAKGKQ